MHGRHNPVIHVGSNAFSPISLILNTPGSTMFTGSSVEVGVYGCGSVLTISLSLACGWGHEENLRIDLELG